jgi:hypothetical protein
MAVANTLSDTITSLNATVPGVIASYKHKGVVYVSRDTAEVAAADDDNSVYRILRLPSNACLFTLNVMNDAITSGTDYNLGVYQTAENGGAVVDDNLFGDAISMAGARTLPFNAMYEGGLDIVSGDTLLWQLLGLTADPHRSYDIAFTAITVGSGAGTLCLECLWSI